MLLMEVERSQDGGLVGDDLPSDGIGHVGSGIYPTGTPPPVRPERLSEHLYRVVGEFHDIVGIIDDSGTVTDWLKEGLVGQPRFFPKNADGRVGKFEFKDF